MATRPRGPCNEEEHGGAQVIHKNTPTDKQLYLDPRSGTLQWEEHWDNPENDTIINWDAADDAYAEKVGK